MEWLLKVLPFLRKWIDKEFEKYLRKKFDEQTDIKKQMDTIKDVLVKEVEEKQFWKEEVDKVVQVERERRIKIMEVVAIVAIDMYAKKIEERFLFIPKDFKMSPYAGMLSSSLEEKIAERPMRKEI